MPVYTVDMSKFSVEKQLDTWLCWAASTRAIALYYGHNASNQAGLAAFYKDKTTGADPRKALKEQFNMSATDVFTGEDVPAGHEIAGRTRDLRDNLIAYLPSGPMLCGLIEAKNAQWSVAGKSKPYTFRHAAVVYKFDSSWDTVWFADPARPDAKGRDVEVSIGDLVTGFPYIAAADLGPTARAMLPAGMSDISVRLYLLSYFMKGK